ncbi:vWA domain-containing protein [Polycladidibacter hongkongensis]|uniref:vWA domain-containing protein n=1 Tax=Polycladidibacter hongkongensis TaxID=1647556 RepID=UPI000829E00C|nr:VWA domain-containing protein [Pseudovibrio hongkongensis]
MAEAEGQLATNMVLFSQALKRAGLPSSSASTQNALQAVLLSGVGKKQDFYWCLHACFVRQRADSEVFAQVFMRFWQKKGLLEKLLALLSPQAPEKARRAEKEAAGARRAREALASPRQDEHKKEEVQLEAELSASELKRFHTKDFGSMSAEEIAHAKKAIANLVLPFGMKSSKRKQVANQGALAIRHSLRGAMACHGELLDLKRLKPRIEPRPVVVLCDISGSVAGYSRMFLHFLHALGQQRRVHTFLFGTELVNVSRCLREKDIDHALQLTSKATQDWQGGTQIGHALQQFNRKWRGRTLSGGPLVLFLSDGLERGVPERLGLEMAMLQRSAHKVIWLNPLLSYEDFEPKARGIKELLPFTDLFLPIHNLRSVTDLARHLSK